MFNPAALMSSQTKDDSSQRRDVVQDKQYKLTGNNTRDQARKLIFEALQEGGIALPPEELTDQLESSLYELCGDPKSKEYRDKTRTIVQKIKVCLSSFHITQQPRRNHDAAQLRSGEITVQAFLKLEPAGKDTAAAAAPQSTPATSGPPISTRPRPGAGPGGFRAPPPPVAGAGGSR